MIEKLKFYKSAVWKARRKEQIISDGGCCVRCGGIHRLIVHHKVAIEWDKPQDDLQALLYPKTGLETLCIYCHNHLSETKETASDFASIWVNRND